MPLQFENLSGSVVSSQSPMTIGKEIDPKVNNYAIRSNKGASVVTMDMNLGERGDFLPSTNRPYGEDKDIEPAVNIISLSLLD